MNCKKKPYALLMTVALAESEDLEEILQETD